VSLAFAPESQVALHGGQKSRATVPLKTVTIMASVKAERILFRLPAMQKNSEVQ
jgi:hypothetical protein